MGRAEISPRTRRPLRSGQTLVTSKGSRAMTQWRLFPAGSRTAVKVLAWDGLICNLRILMSGLLRVVLSRPRARKKARERGTVLL